EFWDGGVANRTCIFFGPHRFRSFVLAIASGAHKRHSTARDWYKGNCIGVTGLTEPPTGMSGSANLAGPHLERRCNAHDIGMLTQAWWFDEAVSKSRLDE